MNMGANIRRIRKEKKLTLKDVSAMTGLTESLISQIENEKANPSISSLMAIASVLNVPIGSFFEHDDNLKNPVIRMAERPVVETKSGVTYYLLTPDIEHVPMEVLFGEYKKDGSTERLYTHEGFECGIVLSGKLEVTIDEKKHILYPGDSITIKSTTPHMITNLFDGTSTAIWINSPPTF